MEKLYRRQLRKRRRFQIRGELCEKGTGQFLVFALLEANGQDETQEACIESLNAAIELLLQDRREDARQRLTDGAELVEIG